MLKKTRKWMILALVISLALPLIGCSSRRSNYSGGAYVECYGDYWSFDVELVKNGSRYDLLIHPTTINDPYDIAMVVIANSYGDYDIVKRETTLVPERTIVVPQLTIYELENFDVLAIVPFDPSGSFLEGTSDKGTFCELPFPGDGGQIANSDF